MSEQTVGRRRWGIDRMERFVTVWLGPVYVGALDHRIWPALFSERYAGQPGIRRRLYLHLGPWCIVARKVRDR